MPQNHPKHAKHIMVTVASVLILAVIWLCFCGWFWNWGPFDGLYGQRMARLPGNAAIYSLENVKVVDDAPLAGKTICFLGSSVTYGTASLGVSFADYIVKRQPAYVTIDKPQQPAATISPELISAVQLLQSNPELMKVLLATQP